jgi:hypothetical protein
MTKKNKKQAVKELREWLVKWTGGCNVQNGFPCGTCACHLLGELMNEESKEYKEHNKPVDRINEVWRAILQIKKAR